MPSDDTWSRLRELETELHGGATGQPGMKRQADGDSGAPGAGSPGQWSPGQSSPGTQGRTASPSAPPTTPSRPQPQPTPALPKRRRRGRTHKTSTWPGRLVRIAVVFVILVLVLGLAGFGYARWRVGQIERVDVSAALAPTAAGGPTWLVVGSDSRDGIDPDRPDAGGLLGEVVPGQRADAIILVREVPGRGVLMLSLPRDLWFDPPGPDNAGRINGALNRGPADLIELIGDQLGIDIHHYAEVDLAGLDDVVEAVGGVTIDIPHPGYDESLGLRIDQSGPVSLDGATALAYVRTRKWVDIIDGVPTPDGTGDLGRTQRQQVFLRALGARVASMRNPFAVNAALSGIADAVRIDGEAGMRDLIALARMIQRAEQSEPLPVRGHVTGGGAHVLILEPGAEQILDRFR